MIPGDLIISVIDEARRQHLQPYSGQANASLKTGTVGTAARAQEFARALETRWQAEVNLAKAVDQGGATTTSPSASHAGLVRQSPKPQNAEVMLQGMLLQSVLEVMLSKQGEALTGKGTAGRIWRSMLAEHIAAEVSPQLDLRLFSDEKDTASVTEVVTTSARTIGAEPARES